MHRFVNFPKTQDVRLYIYWYRARKAGDVDGIIKALMDALEGVLYQNDKQVTELHVHRFDTEKHNPRVDILLEWNA